MKPIRLAIAAVILVGLGGAVWWSNKSEAEKAAKPPEDTTPQILALKEPDIQAIQIHQRDGDVTTDLKKQGDKWSITAPKPLAADQGAVGSLTGAAVNLRGDRLLDGVTDLAGFGLQPPVASVKFTDKSGKATTLLLGEATPTGMDVYAKVEGDNRVYTMSSSHKTEFDKSSKDLRERHLLITDAAKTSGVEVTAKGQAVDFAHTGDNNWQIVKPKTLRADGSAVEEVVRKIRDATMDAETSDQDSAKTAAAFASAQPVATVRITDSGGQKSLEIRKAKDDCYAKSSMLEGAYKANKDLCDGMDKTLDGYRSKKLFDFSFSDPTRVDFKDGAKMVTLEKMGTDWKSGGKTMDKVAIQNLIDKLRDVSASKLVDTGFTTPTIEIGVVAGKYNEKVQISSTNGMFFAHRDGDSTVYQLDTGTVEDIRSAANGVQPAVDEKKQGKK